MDTYNELFRLNQETSRSSNMRGQISAVSRAQLLANVLGAQDGNEAVTASPRIGSRQLRNVVLYPWL